MQETRLPATIPEDWIVVEHEFGSSIVTEKEGLKIIFSIVEVAERSPDTPLVPGIYKHITFSRPNRFPSWEEVANVLENSELFDHDKSVVFVSRPGIEKYFFNFWQLIAEIRNA